MGWEAGDCVVQYRHKAYLPDRDRAELMAIGALAQEMGRRLVVNDRVDLALESGAGGVHLGQGDDDPRAAAALLGPRALIGATVHSMAELVALASAPIHYIGVGPVYGSHSKATGLPDLGLDGLAALAAASPWPVVAIGGIGLAQVPEVLAAGAHGVAVISAFCHAEHPSTVAREFMARLAAG